MADDRQHALADGRHAFSALLDNAVDSIFVKDLDRRYVTVNSAMERVLGLKADQMVGKTAAELFSPEDAAIIAEVDDAAARGEVVDVTRVLHIHGVDRTFHTVQFPVRDSGGTIVGIAGYVRDETARNQAQQQLQQARYELDGQVRESTAELQKQIQLSERRESAIANRNRQLDVLYRIVTVAAQSESIDELARGVVTTTLELLGFSEGGFYVLDRDSGYAVCRFHHGSDGDFRERVQRLPIDNPDSRALYHEGRPMYLDDFPAGRPALAGEHGPRSAAGIPIVSDGTVVAIIGVGSQHPRKFSAFEKQVLEAIGKSLGVVLERLKTRENLRKSEARYRLLAEETTDVIWTSDLSLRFNFISPSVERQRGYTPQEAVTQTIQEIMTPESAGRIQMALMEEITREQRGEHDPYHSRTTEVEMRCKDGSTVWCEAISRFLRDENGNPVGIIGVTRDITDRRRAEESLQENEKKYRHVAEALQEGIWAIDADANTTYVNPAMARMLGYTESEMTGRHLFSFMDERGIELARANLKRRESGVIEVHDFEFLRKDGSRMYATLSTGPIQDENGNYAGAIAGVMDVTDRKRALEALREREETFRALAENSEDTIMRFDRKLRHLYVNPAVERVTGIPPSEFIGKTHREMGFPGPLVEHWESTLQAVIDSGTTQRIEFQLPSGVWIDWLLMPEFGDTGRVEAVITSARDITDYKKSEELLRQAKHELDEAQRIAHVGGWSLDPVTLEGSWSDEMFRLHNRNPDQGTPPADEWLSRIEPEDRINLTSAVSRSIESGEPYDIEFRIHRWGDDAERVHRSIAEVQRDSATDAIRIIGTTADITDQKHAEAEHLRLEEQLRQSQKLEAIGRLAGGVAHDFNNILMGVVGGASMLRRRTPKESEAFKWVEKIADSAQSAALLANQLLAFARGGKYMPAPQDLNELVDSGLELMRSSILTKVWVETDQAEDLPPVEADRAQVFQILMNLCKNAVDAMADEGVIRIETRPAQRSELPEQLADREGGFNVLSVWDSGPGIPEANREHIFDPFFTTKDYGRGLGLAAVYGIVQNHRGAIVVDDAPTGGARFTIFLPTTDQHVAVDILRLQSRSRDTDGRSVTVLVVDDEPTPRDLASSMLESLGHRVVRASSGSQAVEILRRDPARIDAVLLDVVMPEMDGNATFQELAEVKSDLCVVFFSGFLEDMVLPQSTRERAKGFLAKPFTIEELAETMRKCVPAG